MSQELQQLQQVWVGLSQPQPPSVRSLARQTGRSRRSVGRQKVIIETAKRAGVAAEQLPEHAAEVFGTWHGRARPDLRQVDAALENGATLRRVWRDYCRVHGERALGFTQFSQLCRKARGGRSLLADVPHAKPRSCSELRAVGATVSVSGPLLRPMEGA